MEMALYVWHFLLLLEGLVSVLVLSRAGKASRLKSIKYTRSNDLALFSGLVHSSLAVQNLHRKSGLVHHVISATGCVFTSADNSVCCAAESMYNAVRS